MRDLTEQQAAFVAAFTSEPGAIGNASKAARSASYSPKSAGELGRQLLQKPHVLAAIDRANRALIGGALASKAVEVLRAIIEDDEAPPKLRLDAAKTILDRTGIIAPKAREQLGENEAKGGLDGMSVAELQDLKRDMEAQREAELAKTATQH